MRSVVISVLTGLAIYFGGVLATFALWMFLKHTFGGPPERFFPVSIAVNSVRDLIDALDSLDECECIENLTIAAHGAYRKDDDGDRTWMGGFVIGGGDGGRVYGQGGRDGVVEFSAKIGGALCEDGSLNLLSCGGSAGNTLSRMAREIGRGVQVRGARDSVYIRASEGKWYTDGSYNGMRWSDGTRSASLTVPADRPTRAKPGGIDLFER